MKLYTEEQVRRAINLTLDSPDNSHLVIDYLTPIELPTDEEIDNKASDYAEQTGVRYWFIDGAQWMKEQILKQD